MSALLTDHWVPRPQEMAFSSVEKEHHPSVRLGLLSTHVHLQTELLCVLYKGVMADVPASMTQRKAQIS